MDRHLRLPSMRRLRPAVGAAVAIAGLLAGAPALAQDTIDFGSRYENILGQLHGLRESNARFGVVGRSVAASEVDRQVLGIGIKASAAHVQGVAQVSDGRVCWSHSSEAGGRGAVYCEGRGGGAPVVLQFEGDHPGAIQAAGDVIVVPITGGTSGDAKDGYIAFVDASDPARLRELAHLRIRNAGSNVNAAGLVWDTSRRKHYVVVSKNASQGKADHPVYESNGVRLSNPTARFHEKGAVNVFGSQGGVQLLQEKPGGVIYLLATYRDSQGREMITASAIDRLWSTDPPGCAVPCHPREAHLMLNQEFFWSFSHGGAVAQAIQSAEERSRMSIQSIGSFFGVAPGTSVDFRDEIRQFWPGAGFRWGGSLGTPTGRNPKLTVLGVSRHGRDAVQIFYLDGGSGGSLARPAGASLAPNGGPSQETFTHWIDGGLAQAAAESVQAPQATAAITVSAVQGAYQRDPVENDWHRGRILQGPGESLRWTNAAGVSWGLEPDLVNRQLHTNQESPYYASGDRVFALDTQGDRVIGFRFQGEMYRRMAASETLTPATVQGAYQRDPVENDWHRGQIRQAPDGSLRWTNAAGVSWGLEPDLTNRQLRTNQESPYYANGDRIFALEMQGDRVTGFRFHGELYRRVFDSR